MERVVFGETVEAVGTLKEFVADAGSPFGAIGAMSEIFCRWSFCGRRRE